MVFLSAYTGDVDVNGSVVSDDAQQLSRYIAGYDISIELVSADIDVDHETPPRDSMILARHLARWIGYETLPYQD